MTTPFEGGCACGAVRFTGTAEPELTFYCHCLACQRESGGPFSVELFIAKDAVTITGPLNAYKSLADSGNKVVRKACPTCNSPIVLEMEGFPDHVCLKGGAWMTPPGWRPRRTSSRPPSSRGFASRTICPNSKGTTRSSRRPGSGRGKRRLQSRYSGP